MTTWLTSDNHFGNNNIIGYCNRPFENFEEMDETMARVWNEVVAPEDTVWHLGDACMGKIDRSLAIIGTLNGTKILVPGNHDRCWKGKESGEKLKRWEDRYLEAGFAQIAHHPEPLAVEEDMGDGSPPLIHELHLNHFPPAGDSHEEDRYSGMRPDDVGQLLAHGHIHDTWRKKGRWVNVGVDVWKFSPVPVDVVLGLALAPS